jgi:hypothetical protein
VADNSPGISLESITQRVRDLRQAKDIRAEELQAQLDRVTHQRVALTELGQSLERGWVFHTLQLLNDKAKAPAVVEELGVDTVAALRTTCAAESRRIIAQFPRLFEQALTKGQLVVDADSRHPHYTFDDHFIEVRVLNSGKARISDREGPLDDVAAHPDAVVQTVQREHARLFDRPFNGQEVLNRIRRQYLAVIGRQGGQDGVGVPIRHLTARMGKNIKGFRTDEFLVDLSRLVARGPLSIDGWSLDLQHTKDTRQGVLLHGPAGRGYIGFVLFRKEQ